MNRKAKRYARNILEKAKDNMSELAFLRSESMRSFLERMARSISGQYWIKVRFANGVYTDGKEIVLNPKLEIMQDLTTAQKVLVMIGNLAHEFFHIRYTDFRALERLKSLALPTEQRRLKFYFNVIEDAAIELAGTSYYTGSFREGINFVNELCFRAAPMLEELEEQGCSRLQVFDTACMHYCIVGKVKGFPKDKQTTKIFRQAIPILEAGRLEKTAFGRLQKAMELYELSQVLWEDTQEPLAVSYPKNTEISSGGEGTIAEPMPEEVQDFQGNSRKQTQQQFDLATEGESAPADEHESSPTGEAETRSQEEARDEGSPSPPTGNDVGIEEANEADGKSAKTAGQNATDSDFNTTLQGLEEMLEQVKDEAAAEEADRMWDSEQNSKLQQIVDEVEYGDFHEDIRVHTKFPDRDLRDEEAYEELYGELRSLIRGFTRRLKRVIRWNEDVEIYGLEEGELNQAQLWRKDGKIFFERRERSEEADLVVAVLVDESGSMAYMVPSAQKACLMLYEVCSSLGIPISIIGHTARFGEPEVIMKHCVRFDHRNPYEKYNILRLGAFQNTREGVALEYIGQILSKRSEQDKLLIVISDGAPYHDVRGRIFGGERAIEDARNIVKKLERKGIKTVGVAIGEEAVREQISKIYSRYFIGIDEVEKLPMKLVQIIKRNLFKD